MGTVVDMVQDVVCHLNKNVESCFMSWLSPCINKPAFVAGEVEWKFGIRSLKNYRVQVTLFSLLCSLLFS